MITIKVNNLSKTYFLENKQLQAVKDLSFEVSEGEGFGIIGHNGAGKTTVLKMLAGHLKPTSGTVQYNGGISSLIDLGWSMHPQLSGYENIVLAAGMLGVSANEARSKTAEIVAFSDLESSMLEQPLFTFSNGMYLKLAFSIMMSWPKRIMLFDEVLSVGDSRFAVKIATKLVQLKQLGHSLILVSHNLEHINAYCERVIILKNGGSIFEGQPIEAIRKYYDLVHCNHETTAKASEGITLNKFEASGTIINGHNDIFDAAYEIKIEISAFLDITVARHDLVLLMENLRGYKLFGNDTLDWPLHAVSGLCELEWLIPANILNGGNFTVQLLSCKDRRLAGRLGGLHLKLESSSPKRIELVVDSPFYIQGALKPLNGVPFPPPENPVKIETGA